MKNNSAKDSVLLNYQRLTMIEEKNDDEVDDEALACFHGSLGDFCHSNPSQCLMKSRCVSSVCCKLKPQFFWPLVGALLFGSNVAMGNPSWTFISIGDFPIIEVASCLSQYFKSSWVAKKQALFHCHVWWLEGQQHLPGPGPSGPSTKSLLEIARASRRGGDLSSWPFGPDAQGGAPVR